MALANGVVALALLLGPGAAQAAVNAVNNALDTAPSVVGVGPAGSLLYNVAFDSEGVDPVNALVQNAIYSDITNQWLLAPDSDVLLGLGLAILGVVGRSRREESEATA